jgi:Na+/H+-dicarboxylate symporter
MSKLLRLPLYTQIIIALVIAVALGMALGAGKPVDPEKLLTYKANLEHLALPSSMVLRALGMLATPLIFLSIVNTLLTADLPGGAAKRLGFLLTTNTFVAILIGLFVANTVRPGRWSNLPKPSEKDVADIAAKAKGFDPVQLLDSMVPDSIIKPFADKNSVISLVLLGLAMGVALRMLKQRQITTGNREYQAIEHVVTILFSTIINMLHWVIMLVPLAVLGIVAKTIALKGFDPFKSLLFFVIAVILGLALQASYYLIRIQLGSWVSAKHLLTHGLDPLIAAFSTASSTATMPITYETLIEKVGLRKSSASLGALVGSNFNNDGTALYEAMSALFISQSLVAQGLGVDLNIWQQILVILTSIFASVGAAGIPEAGLVTMTLVFNSVGLPLQYIAILLTVDWFLDRVRTAINVMGDMTVSCLVDGKQPKTPETVEDEALNLLPE